MPIADKLHHSHTSLAWLLDPMGTHQNPRFCSCDGVVIKGMKHLLATKILLEFKRDFYMAVAGLYSSIENTPKMYHSSNLMKLPWRRWRRNSHTKRHFGMWFRRTRSYLNIRHWSTRVKIGNSWRQHGEIDQS